MKESPNPKFEFLPVSIRLETAGGVATPLVLRGTPLPAKRSQLFSTAADNQSSVEVSLCLGESPLVRGNLQIGKFKLNGIPAANRGKPQIAIEFAVDPTCAVTARATLQDSEVSAQERFELPVELSDEFIARVLANAESTRQADETELLQIEATNRAKALIEQAERRLEQSPNEKLSEAVAAVGLALASKNSAKIRKEGDGLERLLEPPGAAPFSDIFTDFFPYSAKPLSRAPKKSRVVSPHFRFESEQLSL